MNTTRSVLFALLSLGFLAASANAQNADVNEVEKLKAEIARLKAELATRPEDIDRLREEAGDFYGKGKYRKAKASMTRAYAAFERLEVKDKTKRVSYLQYLSNISNKLEENDKTIEYATEVAIHALTDDDRGFAYDTLGLAYRNKGGLLCCHRFYSKEYDAFFEKLIPRNDSIEIDLRDIELKRDLPILVQVFLFKENQLFGLLEELGVEAVPIYAKILQSAYSFFAENDYDSGKFVEYIDSTTDDPGTRDIIEELKKLHEEFVKKACKFEPSSPINKAFKEFFSHSSSDIGDVLNLEKAPSKTALFLLGMFWLGDRVENEGATCTYLSSHLSLLFDSCTSMELKDGHIRINLKAFDEKVDKRRVEALKQYYDISKSINDLKGKEEELTKERQQHSKRNSDLQNEVKELKVAGSGFDKEIKKLKEENAEIQKQNETLKTDIDELKDEGKKLIEAKEKLAEKNSILKGEIDEAETAGRDMEEKNSAQGEGNADEESVDSSRNIQVQTEMDIASDDSSGTED
jgi:predicted nuclease with TOPRIM domain